jgi:hypothetical protein
MARAIPTALVRRAVVFAAVAAGTAAASSAWLSDGDLVGAVSPVVPVAEWNADALAAKEGIVPAAAPVVGAGAPEPRADEAPPDE